jgi:hypothetical protein
MEIDARKLEAELPRILRGLGVSTTDFYGVQYVGICSTDILYSNDKPNKVRVPTMPNGQAVSLAVLAQEIAEALR